MGIGDARAANRTLVTISRRSGSCSTPRKSLFIRQFRRYLTWSKTFSSRSAHAAVSGASAEDTAGAVVAIVAGNVVEIEERLLALERHAGITPKNARPFF